MTPNTVIDWLLKGDISVQYQVYRDLLKSKKSIVDQLQQNIPQKGWGKKLLSNRNSNGMWGGGLYNPKWTSTHYTLLLLKNIGLPQGLTLVNESVSLLLDAPKAKDGGISVDTKGIPEHSDVCVNGMILNFSAYFIQKDKRLNHIVDYLLSIPMTDGGWNCRHHRGAVHSSLHTTLSVLEGLYEFQKQGNKYRAKEINAMRESGKEFILQHRLYRSDKTGNVIRSSFKLLSFPCHWYYDILKALDHFRDAGYTYDERMQDALDVIYSKKDKNGKWPLQGKHPGRMHFEMENARQPSRWNTLRAMRVLNWFSYNTTA